MLSDRDVLRVISPYADGHTAQRRDDETLQLPVYNAASYNMIAVARDTPIELAAAAMLEHHISCLLGTGLDEEVVGIVTTRDLFRATVSCLITERPAEEQPAA